MSTPLSLYKRRITIGFVLYTLPFLAPIGWPIALKYPVWRWLLWPWCR